MPFVYFQTRGRPDIFPSLLGKSTSETTPFVYFYSYTFTARGTTHCVHLTGMKAKILWQSLLKTEVWFMWHDSDGNCLWLQLNRDSFHSFRRVISEVRRVQKIQNITHKKFVHIFSFVMCKLYKCTIVHWAWLQFSKVGLERKKVWWNSATVFVAATTTTTTDRISNFAGKSWYCFKQTKSFLILFEQVNVWVHTKTSIDCCSTSSSVRW